MHKALPGDLPSEVSAFGFSQFVGWFYTDIFSEESFILGPCNTGEKEEETWP